MMMLSLQPAVPIGFLKDRMVVHTIFSMPDVFWEPIRRIESRIIHSFYFFFDPYLPFLVLVRALFFLKGAQQKGQVLKWTVSRHPRGETKV